MMMLVTHADTGPANTMIRLFNSFTYHVCIYICYRWFNTNFVFNDFENIHQNSLLLQTSTDALNVYVAHNIKEKHIILDAQHVL